MNFCPALAISLILTACSAAPGVQDTVNVMPDIMGDNDTVNVTVDIHGNGTGGTAQTPTTIMVMPPMTGVPGGL